VTELLRDVEAALIDLGACKNPECKLSACLGVLPRVRAALRAQPAPKRDDAVPEEWLDLLYAAKELLDEYSHRNMYDCRVFEGHNRSPWETARKRWAELEDAVDAALRARAGAT
jgi:hypothetical protein